MERIKQAMPVLTDFDQEELEEWADAVSKLIISFNIMDKNELLVFATKVTSLLPKQCTPQFRQAAERILDEICCDKVDAW
jgi:hypothetical protein